MFVYDRISVNLVADEITPQVEVVQGDTGRGLLIDIGMTFTNPQAYAYVDKADGHKVFNNCSISGSMVTVEYSAQMLAAAGMNYLQIMITENLQRVTTFDIPVLVKKSRVDNSAIESTDEYRALEELIASVAPAVQAANAATTAANNAANNANAKATAANKAANAATTAAQTAATNAQLAGEQANLAHTAANNAQQQADRANTAAAAANNAAEAAAAVVTPPTWNNYTPTITLTGGGELTVDVVDMKWGQYGKIIQITGRFSLSNIDLKNNTAQNLRISMPQGVSLNMGTCVVGTVIPGYTPTQTGKETRTWVARPRGNYLEVSLRPDGSHLASELVTGYYYGVNAMFIIL